MNPRIKKKHTHTDTTKANQPTPKWLANAYHSQSHNNKISRALFDGIHIKMRHCIGKHCAFSLRNDRECMHRHENLSKCF